MNLARYYAKTLFISLGFMHQIFKLIVDKHTIQRAIPEDIRVKFRQKTYHKLWPISFSKRLKQL